MEAIKIIIENTINRNKTLNNSLIGFLNNKKKESSYISDLDFFTIIGTNIPSNYLPKSIELCNLILDANPNVFIFSSFKQQILLKQILKDKNIVLLHYLQYLSPNHLVIREVNTLPKFISECIDTIVIKDNKIFQNITHAYNHRDDLLNSDLIRIYYYFDILNETVPLYLNLTKNLMPQNVLKLELLHKLKFISQHIGYELLVNKYEKNIEEINLNDFDDLLKENKFYKLISLRKEIKNILKTNLKSLNQSQLMELIRISYSFFDNIKILKNSL